MIKESERVAFAPLVIINEKTVFGGEGFTLTQFGSNLQGIFIKRRGLNELAAQDGAIKGELKQKLEEEIGEQCNNLGIPRQDKFLDVLERQFATIVNERREAAIRLVSKVIHPK